MGSADDGEERTGRRSGFGGREAHVVREKEVALGTEPELRDGQDGLRQDQGANNVTLAVCACAQLSRTYSTYMRCAGVAGETELTGQLGPRAGPAVLCSWWHWLVWAGSLYPPFGDGC